MTDVAIIGGGIVGVSAAAHLAAAGASVELWEREAVGAAASGRNSGSVQHPFDPVLAPLHAETVEVYRGLLDWTREPAGLLMLARAEAGMAAAADRLAQTHPELEPRFLDPAAVRGAEPALAEGLFACRLRTGWPVRPLAATAALAERARAAGAALHVGEEARVWVEGASARGVRVGGRERGAGAVLVAAGPWSPGLVDPTGGWRPIVALWGALAEVRLERPPVHVVEEAGVEEIGAGAGAAVLQPGHRRGGELAGLDLPAGGARRRRAGAAPARAGPGLRPGAGRCRCAAHAGLPPAAGARRPAAARARARRRGPVDRRRPRPVGHLHGAGRRGGGWPTRCSGGTRRSRRSWIPGASAQPPARSARRPRIG